MEDSSVAILVVSALIVLIFYRRARRLFVRQRYRTSRLLLRAGLFGLLVLFLLPVLSIASGMAPVAGLVLGVALGLYGYSLTRFEVDEGRVHFTPNRYIGVVILTMFAGRLIYRLLIVGRLGDLVTTGARSLSDLRGLGISALTAGLLFVLLGYFLTYYVAIAIGGKKLHESIARSVG